MRCLGFDIGGTKCAVTVGELSAEGCRILRKERFPTPEGPGAAVGEMMRAAGRLLEEEPGEAPAACGVSCGGPLDSRRGVILSPPNLPGWDGVEITACLRERFGVPAFLQNDANACAVAEWRFGAGQGCRNMVFCTFGTGFGTGLILDGRLYVGENDNAGEAGHVRLESWGPVGYGKAGSVEGFCSGAGIAGIGRLLAEERIQQGCVPGVVRECGGAGRLTAKALAEAANAGDPFAAEVYRRCGAYLGRTMAILVDILNPGRIVLGSVFARSENLLRDAMEETLRAEALPLSAAVCGIVPAALGETLGDVAALSVAYNGLCG